MNRCIAVWALSSSTIHQRQAQFRELKNKQKFVFSANYLLITVSFAVERTKSVDYSVDPAIKHLVYET